MPYVLLPYMHITAYRQGFGILFRSVKSSALKSYFINPSGGRGTDWTLLAAIETLFLIPVFLVTFFLQDHLLRGVTFGTVKR